MQQQQSMLGFIVQAQSQFGFGQHEIDFVRAAIRLNPGLESFLRALRLFSFYFNVSELQYNTSRAARHGR